MTEEIRPICLYVETCLDKKEGTKDCAKCEHHLNYWTEVMIRDMEKNIKRLEQENKKLKEEIQFHNKENSNLLAERNAAQIGYDEIREVRERYRSALEEIREIFDKQLPVEVIQGKFPMIYYSEYFNREKQIIDKITEVLQCE